MTTKVLWDQHNSRSLDVFNDFLISQRLEDIKRFGIQSMAYSALQADIQEFRDPSCQGFIPYLSVWGVDYVLSDPIAPRTDLLKITQLFLNKRKNVVFCQISQAYAQLLNELNFTVNGFGVEHMIHFDDFEVSWKKRKRLKSYLSSLTKKDYYVFELKADLEEIKKINEEWLKAKNNGRELRFMARPFVDLSQEDVRYFYLLKDKKILGYASFDPIYSPDGQQKIVSYGLQHLRVLDLAPAGSQDFLVLNALFQFKEEGFKKISLGLSPLYERNNSQFKYSKFCEYVFSFFYRFDLLYQYRSMGEHKEQYKAEKHQTYVAVKNGFSIKHLCGLLKVNNLI